LWFCFLSVKTHNNGQQLGLGFFFSSALTSLTVFLAFLIFKFPTASARTPPKIKFLIPWTAANGVHRKFIGDIRYQEKQTRQKASAACLPLAHSYG